MKKGDLIIVAIVVLVALAGGLFYFFTTNRNEENAMIIVELNGVEVGREPLYERGRDRIIVYDGPVGQTEVQFLEQGARVLASDCPDKICIQYGLMGRPGNNNACLPNRVVFRIVGGTDETDINTR